MRIVVLIARVLLGLIFAILPANLFFHFMPAPIPPGAAGQFVAVTFQTHFLHAIAFFEIVSGLLLLANFYVPLALTVLAGILVNIVLFHALILQGGLFPAPLLAIVLWGIVFWSVRSAFSGIFAARVSS